jgi:putative addiction module component (TIGR02574 family)
MSMTRDELKAEVLSLPPEDREWLIELLVTSLDSEADFTPAQLRELERRGEEMASGKVPGIPAEEFFARVRSRLQ